MKISGVKFNVNVDVGEFDLDLKDVLDIQRLQWEQRRELRKECHDVCETDRRFEELSKAGPSSETKTFVEAIVNKAISKIKDPDTSTDYEIDEYDGWESIIYVVNGKLYHA